MFITWLYTGIVLASLCVRVLLAGSTRWTNGLAAFAAASLYVIGTRTSQLICDALVYKNLDLWNGLYVLELGMIPAVLAGLKPARYAIALSLFVPGLGVLFNVAELGWKGVSWDERAIFLAWLYVGCYLAPAMAFAPAVTEYIRSPLRPPVRLGHCPQCGYDLTGNVTGRCPECGLVVQSD